MFTVIKSFEHILAFSLVSNGLEPFKPLVTKLQNANKTFTYKGYQIIDCIISELKGFRANVDIKLEHWFNFAVKLGEEVNTIPSVLRLAKS